MSESVTEVAYIPITSSISLESGEGKDIWQATLKTIASQKGFKRLSWGTQIENPSIAQLAIDWESLEAHKAFIASDAYGPFLDHLKPILDSAPDLFHVKLPSGTPPFDAPVTECISLYFEPSVEESAYNDTFSKFVAEASKIPDSGVTAFVGGWGVEPQMFDHEGDEKKFFGAFIGWPSVEKHMEFRKTEEFPKIVGLLREGVDKVKVHHVAFKRFEV